MTLRAQRADDVLPRPPEADWPARPGMAGPADAPRPPDPAAYAYRHPVLPWVVRSIDAATVLGTTALTAWLVSRGLTEQQDQVLAVANLVALIVFALFPKNQRLLDLPHLVRAGRQARYLAPALLSAILLQLVIYRLFAWRGALLLEPPAIWLGGAVAGIGVARGLGTALLRRPAVGHRLSRKVAIVGSGAHAIHLAEHLSRAEGSSFHVAGLFDDGARRLGDHPVQGGIADLVALSRAKRLDGIVIALPPSPDHEHKVSRLSWRLRTVLADIYIMPHLVHGPDVLLPVEQVGPYSLMVLRRRPLTEWQSVRKAAIDLLFTLVALVLVLPLLVAVACAIKLDSPGPVLFRQPRLGFNNCEFTVFKFRSMHTNMTDVMAARQTSRGDPRVTRVGRWLRRLSIDELPQLLNVLRGEMSLVGPRPHAPHTRAGGKLLDDALAEYMIRHQVKPGITGWAQVNGARGELVTLDDLQRRVALDLDYIKNWSVRFDLKIMALTVLREVLSRHAF